MIWIFILIIIVVTVAVVSYPLFRNKLQGYNLPEEYKDDVSKLDSWLSAISDLEDDHVLGRISKKDYLMQKKILQSNYLMAKKNLENNHE